MERQVIASGHPQTSPAASLQNIGIRVYHLTVQSLLQHSQNPGLLLGFAGLFPVADFRHIAAHQLYRAFLLRAAKHFSTVPYRKIFQNKLRAHILIHFQSRTVSDLQPIRRSLQHGLIHHDVRPV